jgi:hypothetical protein
VANYNKMEGRLLEKVVVKKIKYSARDAPTLAQSTFPTLLDIRSDQLKAVREEYDIYRKKNEDFYTHTASELAADTELKTIFNSIISRCNYHAVNYLIR